MTEIVVYPIRKTFHIQKTTVSVRPEHADIRQGWWTLTDFVILHQEMPDLVEGLGAKCMCTCVCTRPKATANFTCVSCRHGARQRRMPAHHVNHTLPLCTPIEGGEAVVLLYTTVSP